MKIFAYDPETGLGIGNLVNLIISQCFKESEARVFGTLAELAANVNAAEAPIVIMIVAPGYLTKVLEASGRLRRSDHARAVTLVGLSAVDSYCANMYLSGLFDLVVSLPFNNAALQREVLRKLEEKRRALEPM